MVKCYKSQLLHNSEEKLDAFQGPIADVTSIQRNDFLVVNTCCWAWTSVLQRRAQQFTQNGYSFQRMGPQEPGPETQMEGERKEKPKKVHLILKATAEQQVREPGRQRQAKEAMSAHQQEKLRWNGPSTTTRRGQR